MKKTIIGVAIALAVLVIGGALYWFVFRKNLNDEIVIPYIAHQKPRIDPHVPSSVPLADKLAEVVFDGLFDVKAGASGIVYEDGLGEYLGHRQEQRRFPASQAEPEMAFKLYRYHG